MIETAVEIPDGHTGENEYVVRLLMRIKADSPPQAVQAFVEQVTRYGLREWRYRVEDLSSGELSHYTGFGIEEETLPEADAEADVDEEVAGG